ncbi:hypothetical protein FACS189437_09620 [Bacteroidia bacterium]|nr:hypothetical protein FACS189437_09620 [Bacteroidia bacterium]
MRRFATTYFAINRSELLDPVVSLFLESMAEEVYKIAGEIDNLENRIVNRLSNMLVPDTDTIAKPAHAILHASPTESRLELTTSTEFYYSGYDKNKNRLSFYPVCNTRLYKGDIRYFVCNGLLYATGSDQLRTPVTGNGRKELLAAHSFWIALELDPAVENLSGLSFYIDFQGVYNKNEYQLVASKSTSTIEKESALSAKKIEETAEKVSISSTKEDMDLASTKKVNVQSSDKINLF